jgi:hypothetical protein
VQDTHLTKLAPGHTIQTVFSEFLIQHRTEFLHHNCHTDTITIEDPTSEEPQAPKLKSLQEPLNNSSLLTKLGPDGLYKGFKKRRKITQ